MSRAQAIALDWARENLFKSWKDGVLTVVFGALLGYITISLLLFVFVDARWTIISENMRLFLVGPAIRGDELLITGAAMLLAVFMGTMAGGALSRRSRETRAAAPLGLRDGARAAVDRLWPILLLSLAILVLAQSPGAWVFTAATAGVAGLGWIAGSRAPRRLFAWILVAAAITPIVCIEIIVHVAGVGWDEWGGFLLTLFLAAASIILSFPLGVLLALGRRSKLPVIRFLSVIYIEFFRGVPLVVLLLMGSLTIGFFLPREIVPGQGTRAIIVFTLFTAAYFAEIVRGGLQSVPHGQEEAAKAVGLSPWRVTGFIVLPQALRSVIPAIVGQMISLFKDTSLVFIIGFTDLLGLATTVTGQPEFRGQGLVLETLLFVAAIYWVGSFTMSRESQRLERKLGVGAR